MKPNQVRDKLRTIKRIEIKNGTYEAFALEHNLL